MNLTEREKELLKGMIGRGEPMSRLLSRRLPSRLPSGPGASACPLPPFTKAPGRRPALRGEWSLYAEKSFRAIMIRLRRGP